MRDQNYQADIAGLEFGANLQYQSNINFTIKGYNHSLDSFMDYFLKELEKFSTHNDEKRFDMIYAKLTKDKKNVLKDQPNQLAFYHYRDVTHDRHMSNETLAETIETINFNDYKDFKKHIFKELRIEVLIEGNIEQEFALKKVDDFLIAFERIYNTKWVPKAKIEEQRLVCFQPNQVWIAEKMNAHADDQNCCYLASYQVGPGSFYRPQLEFMSVLIKDKYFGDIRTDQCLGYLVWSFKMERRGVYSFDFVVQSNVQNPNYLSLKTREF